ncbi:uncharacterized protein FIBRA_08118 [Fibroporia radiculosa]|uniref:Vacuolar membrane-associated protein IML1 n=1 Tax=Fibroporia radiculosa TaxID=599839 RepID=J4IC67_9APHY|nr:uncharacterized protein FIBRA_08118 [Fibroporia radiculosa]CCM05881.1 predicted protein [Fibroporia radiculosa]
MSTSRAESQAPSFGRRRSNTAQSIFKSASLPTTPLKVGDSKTLTTWVHDIKESPHVIINHSWWPGVAEGDIIRIGNSSVESSSGFLFSVQKDDGFVKHQLQVSVPRPLADQFGLRNNGEVVLTKIEASKYSADYVELTFVDQYLGRNEMWRLSSHLVGQCIHVEQDISFIGVIAAKVQGIVIGGRKVPAAYVTSTTRTVYRSLSAKVTIFIQVCRELWEFAGDGERYNEKIVHSFLPALFSKWREAGTNHIVTIVLISRVYYDESEIAAAAGPLRKDIDGHWYKDFFKVITDIEVLYDWKPTLVDLKNSFWAFQRDILLAHHFHRATLISSSQPGPDHVRLIGQLSYAHDGPLLEALNLGLNPTETHYIDRSLSLTGSSTIIITPGTGFYRVSKQLLRLTTTRLLDQGFGLELVSLAKPPLHQSPIFSFQSVSPENAGDFGGKIGARALDPLWGGDDGLTGNREQLETFWWEPFWLAVTFWDKQVDLPFRKDRFVARARIPEIEMLGLLDHDVLSNIEIPFLSSDHEKGSAHGITSAKEADDFDMEIFTVRSEGYTDLTQRMSTLSSASTVTSSLSSRLNDDLRRSSSGRISAISTTTSIIEENLPNVSSELNQGDLSFDTERRLLSAAFNTLSTSPSQLSIRSNKSARSQTSTASAVSSASTRSHTERQAARDIPPKKSRFNPSWLFGSFRSSLSQPQTSPISVSTLSTARQAEKERGDRETSLLPMSHTSSHVSTAVSTPRPRSPLIEVARTLTTSRPSRPRLGEEELLPPSHSSLPRQSPIGTLRLEDPLAGMRRTMNKSGSLLAPVAPYAFTTRTNPSKPLPHVSYTQSSLASRWQHMFPRPLSKHDTNWKAMITPGCLPLTVEYIPSASELGTEYSIYPYEFAVDPQEMRSFFLKPPAVSGSAEDVRRAWARVLIRGMVALRIAQGFQLVLRSSKAGPGEEGPSALRRSRSYVLEDDITTPRPISANLNEILRNPEEPIFLSMSNEIHRIAYSGDAVQVRRYVRKMPQAKAFEYQCLIWPKLGVGYTELSTSFISPGIENYHWNRLDMLIAGFENQWNESIRYWRTRFVVIPTDDHPLTNVGPKGEKLSDEEVRLMGIDKLAELFTKARWCPPEDRGKPIAPVRFLTTDLGPAACIFDESLTAQLDEIHATGPLRKKVKSDRDIVDLSLSAIAKAMREEDGLPIKDHKWHGIKYANSFTGADFVSWVVREFRDVSSREQGIEWGVRLQEQGLFDHCRGTHSFLDGHYFYALRGEYVVAATPRVNWFRSARHVSGEEASTRSGFYPSSSAEKSALSAKKPIRRLILSQSMILDIDPQKRSDQAESIILHYDIIHNPATCFHFELQWLGTTARCIDDLLRQWSRTIERYGLKLVEAYVTQICDIRDRNPFQSCFPLPLAVPPPIVPDLNKRVPEGMQTRHYFEYAILRKFGFVLDIEAASFYPDQTDVVYSYRRSSYKYSQWVHRSGVAFVQVLGGSQGFLFLTNRLMAPGRIGTALKYQRPAAAADEIRSKLQSLCSDPVALTHLYDEELGQLDHDLEEPPPLRI